MLKNIFNPIAHAHIKYSTFLSYSSSISHTSFISKYLISACARLVHNEIVLFIGEEEKVEEYVRKMRV
jgi:hypothetical protein